LARGKNRLQKRSSILPRVTTSLIGLITVVSLVLSSILIVMSQRRQLADLETRATATADHLARTLEFPVWNAVLREIEAQLGSALMDPSLYGIIFESDAFSPPVHTWARDADWIPQEAAPIRRPGIVSEKRIIEHEGQKIADIELLFSDRFIFQSVVREALIYGCLVLAEALSIAIGLYLILRGLIFRPLRAIEQWASDISLGEIAPLPPSARAKGEIASLRGSIERMVGLLGDRYDAVVQAEKQTRTALDQKGALVQELFHRTRNNFQVLSSIIGLRENRVENETARSELRSIHSRMYSISLAQEELYKYKDLSFVDLGSYLETLVGHMVQERAGSSIPIRAEIEADSLPVLLDIALPLGLAVAELVENSLDHAFPKGRSGTIYFSLKMETDGYVEVSLRDDGVGPPPGFDPVRDSELGLETAMALVSRQIKGKLSFDFSSGFAVSIRFKLEDSLFAPRV
jgi:two-component sensor histidine kinase